MTKTDKQEFKKLIKESILEVLKSEEGQNIIVRAMVAEKKKTANYWKKIILRSRERNREREKLFKC